VRIFLLVIRGLDPSIAHHTAVFARLDRTIQYSGTVKIEP
jgi:hypothetical protein